VSAQCDFYGHSHVGTGNCVYCNMAHPSRNDDYNATCGRCGHFWDWHGKRDNGACKGGYPVGLTVTSCQCREERPMPNMSYGEPDPEWGGQHPKPMSEYMLTDDQGDEYSYAASDMRMALVVHQQIQGTNVQKAEQI